MPGADRVFVTLYPSLIEHADKVGHERHERGVGAGGPVFNHGNHAPRDRATALSRDIDGMRCEAAGWLWASPVRWHDEIVIDRSTLSDIADLDNFIDVKGVDHPRKRLLVQCKDEHSEKQTTKPNWAYLLVDGSAHPRYEIVGWCWGWEALKHAPVDDLQPGRPCHVIGRASPILKPPWLLLADLRWRQERRVVGMRHPDLKRDVSRDWQHPAWPV